MRVTTTQSMETDSPPPLVAVDPECTCGVLCPTHKLSVSSLLDPSPSELALSDDDDCSMVTYVTEPSQLSSPFPSDPIRFSGTLPDPPPDEEAFAAGAAVVEAALEEDARNESPLYNPDPINPIRDSGLVYASEVTECDTVP